MSVPSDITKATKTAKFISDVISKLGEDFDLEATYSPGTSATPGTQVRLDFLYESHEMNALKKILDEEGIKYDKKYHDLPKRPFFILRPAEFDKVLKIEKFETRLLSYFNFVKSESTAKSISNIVQKAVGINSTIEGSYSEGTTRNPGRQVRLEFLSESHELAAVKLTLQDLGIAYEQQFHGSHTFPGIGQIPFLILRSPHYDKILKMRKNFADKLASNLNVVKAQNTAKYIDDVFIKNIGDGVVITGSYNTGTKENPGLQFRLEFLFESDELNALKKTLNDAGINFDQRFHVSPPSPIQRPFLIFKPAEFDKVLKIRYFGSAISENLTAIKLNAPDNFSAYEAWWSIHHRSIISNNEWKKHDAMLNLLITEAGFLLKKIDSTTKSANLNCPGFNEQKFLSTFKNELAKLQDSIKKYNQNTTDGGVEHAMAIRKSVDFFRSAKNFQVLVETKSNQEKQKNAYSLCFPPVVKETLQKRETPKIQRPTKPITDNSIATAATPPVAPIHTGRFHEQLAS